MSCRGRGRGSGQNDLLAQIAAVLTNMNENLQHLKLDEFCRRNPSPFQGGFAPDAAIEWIQRLERIFKAMSCSDAQKLAYDTYLQEKEAESWWEFTRRQMEAEGQVILWCTFREIFLRKYFPADLRSHKEMEFLRL
ncbi:hypothetical protein Lal_00043675 [Lupinus albus]|nr:hypothetical protein Lal_00043675 [Lupinus albus]